MLLMEKPNLTEKQKCAARAQGRRSPGMATAAGWARVRDAHRRETRRLTDRLLETQGQERPRPTRKAGG